MSMRRLHPRHSVLLLAGVMAVAVIAGFAFDLNREHRLAVEYAGQRTQRMARLLEEHAHQHLHRIELDLAAVVATLGPRDGLQPAGIAELRRLLQQGLPADGLIRALVLIGPNGDVLGSTSDEARASAAAFIKGTEFGALRQGTSGVPLIGAPLELGVQAVAHPTRALPVAVRIGLPGAVSQGALLAFVDLDAFQRFYNSLDTGENGFATIFLRDGWIAVRTPVNPAVTTRNWSGSPLFRTHIPQAQNGTVRQVVAADQVERVYSYRVVQDQAMVVTFGISLTDALAGWHKRVALDAAILLAAMLALAAATWGLVREITRRDAAQRLLSDRESAFLNLSEEPSDWRWKLDADLRFISTNGDTKKGTIARTPVYLGKTPWEVAWANLTEADLERQRQVLLSHQPFRDFEVQRPDVAGAMTWVSTSAMPIFDKQGRFEGYRGVGRDISQRKQAENALRLSEQSLAITLQSIGDAVIATEPDGRISRMNTAAENLCGWTFAQACGRALVDVFCLVDVHTRLPVPDPVQRALADNPVPVIDPAHPATLLARDGREHQVTACAAPIRGATGGVEGVVLVLTDVTRMYGDQQALRERESQLSRITDVLQGPVSRVDRDGRYLFANAAFERWFGVCAAEVIGRSESEVTGAAYYAQAQSHIARALAGQRADFECEVQSAAHGTLHGQVTLLPDMAADGTVCGHVAIVVDITERKRREHQAVRETMRLRVLFEQAGDAVFVMNENLDVVEANASFARLIGCTLEEALARRPWEWSLEYTTPEMCAARWPQAPRIQETYATRWRDGRGGARDVEVSINRVEWGGELLMMCVCRDISERRRAEIAFETQRLRMEGIIESAMDGIITIDADEHIVVFNSAAERMFGYRAADVVGQALDRLLPERLRDAHHANIRSFGQSSETNRVIGECGQLGQNSQLGQLCGLRADGKEFPIEASISRIEVAGHKFYAVALRDVTLQLQSREQLTLLQTCVEHLNDIVMITEAEPFDEPGPRIVFVNQAFERRTGYRRDEVLGRTPRLLQGPRTERSMLDRISAALKRAEPVRCELINYTKDGDEFWLELDIVPITNAQGKLTHWVAVERDISERKKAESSRLGLEAQLRESQKMESMGTLAGGIAHDFNNILASILGNVALARDDVGAGHAALARLSQIGRAARRARALVQQILAFSRRQPQELVVQPLQPLIQDTMAMLRSSLPAMVTLQPLLCIDPVFVLADTTQMQQTLMNLCTNAWHALQGRPGNIQVGLDVVVLGDGNLPGLDTLPAGRYAHLWVTDNGVGMDQMVRDRIFEPFFTTKPVGTGTGLGLSVVHGIVSAHHGAITVKSEPGAGSTFHLYFPAHTGQLEATFESRFDPSALASLEGSGQHVMYVDDDEVMVVMVGQLLERAGFRVTCCADARQAMALVAANPYSFDIVVTDYNMPELSGLDLARWLAQFRPELPVVISSGYISDDLREPARLAGVRRLMHKQNTLEELSGLIREVLSTS